MSLDYAQLYLGIMFANVVYLGVLLYGGMWYTSQTTVKCPKCGVRYSKYRVGGHECHPVLVADD